MLAGGRCCLVGRSVSRVTSMSAMNVVSAFAQERRPTNGGAPVLTITSSGKYRSIFSVLGISSCSRDTRLGRWCSTALACGPLHRQDAAEHHEQPDQR